MGKLFCTLLLLVTPCVHAQWQADLESGQGDAIGILLFFFGFAAWGWVRDEFKVSKAKGYKALLICAAILLAAVLIPVVRIVAAVIFLLYLGSLVWDVLRR